MEKLVALYKNREYIVGELGDNCNFSTWNFEEKMQFPKIRKFEFFLEVVESLKKRFINVVFYEDGDYYVVFDKNQEEYENWKFPVYVDMFGEIKATGKYIDIDIPTPESIEAAKNIEKKVNDEIYKVSMEHAAEVYVQNIKDDLKENNGIMYVCLTEKEYQDYYDVIRNNQMKILLDKDYIKRHSYYGVTNIYHHVVLGIPEMLYGKEEVDLFVPADRVGAIIGHKGDNVKEMLRALFYKCKRINVKASN